MTDPSLFDSGQMLNSILNIIKHLLSLMGGFVIFLGASRAILTFFSDYFGKNALPLEEIDAIRLKFGRHIVLGLEFIVAADVIETTTTPDYYSIGILAILVVLRSFLTYFLSREINDLKQQSSKNSS